MKGGNTRHSSPRPALRLLCALLLMLTPLLSPAAALAPPSPTDIADLAGNPASDQMPCHGGAAAAQQAEAEPEPACPHCDRSSTSLQCECCDAAAPAGAMLLSVNAYLPANNEQTYRGALSSPSPCDPCEQLFRPPIQFG